MNFGSQNLRLFRRAIWLDGKQIEEAANLAGMTPGEARLTYAEDQRNPPPPAAFELLHNPDAPAEASTSKDNDMARGRRMAREPEETMDAEAGEGAGINGEYKRPDAAKAFDIYDKQIAPKLTHLSTLKGDLSQPYDDIKEHANFPRKVLNFIISLDGEEDAKRDHMLLALHEGLKHRGYAVPRDLVTMMEGADGDDIVPAGEREDVDMFSDDGDDDEADEDDFEAKPEELTRQTARKKPASGTAAAAMAAMNEAAASAAIN